MSYPMEVMTLSARPESHWLPSVFRYLISGGAATLLHWSLMAWLVQAGTSPGISTAAGALAGALLNYALQFHFTFQSNLPHRATAPRYLQVTAASWMANNVTFFLLFHFAKLSPVPAQVLTTLLIIILNFYLYRRLVFNERNHVTLGS